MKSQSFIMQRLAFLAFLALALGLTAAQAQVTWQTTATTINGYNSGSCSLVYGTMKVTVFPAYLDVEEDVEISTAGTVTTGNDPNTLEIVANFTLPAGASIVGALLWDGDKILQGKLLDRATADSIYEDLVDRNSTPPPRPRDPLILELTGTNTYRLRVYPVALGRSRHFRLRYQLPPKIGVDGFEIRLQAAILPFFTPSSTTISANFVAGGSTEQIIFVQSGLKQQIELPRNKFLTLSSLTASAAAGTSALRILPVDPLRQVMVKTSFPEGSFTGNYLNLYAGISENLMQRLGQRVEVVVFWKWHNPGVWIQNGAVTSYVTTAKSQASQLLSLYGVLGVPGTRVGLLHDDSRNSQRRFPVASNTEASYLQAKDYLTSVQGNFAEDFARGLQILPGNGGSNVEAIDSSKNRFLENMRLVKTLYSPAEGVTRHLILLSAGPEYSVPNAELNKGFDSIFADKPLSFGSTKNGVFNQVGFDYWSSRTQHPLPPTMVSNTYADLPGFPAMSVLLTVRNEKTAYDFNIACTAGLGINCGTLEFHGKSTVPWEDSLSWEAYRSDGLLLGKTRTESSVFEEDQDTGTAILWASSTSPFSDKKELPYGPVYGFVDKWASMLAVASDSMSAEQAAAYADAGVPRIANESLFDVIPNYAGSTTTPGGTGCPSCVVLAIGDALKAALKNPALWRLELGRDGTLFLRIPGMTSGVRVELALYDLSGKRVNSWNLVSETGFLRWNASDIRSGAYLLKVRIGDMQGVKRIAL